jgi:hypothetical protein
VRAVAAKKQTSRSLDSRTKYTGQLAEPIYEPIGGLLAEFTRNAAERRAQEQQVLKLRALFAWYGIDSTTPDAFTGLAIALALAHVPGMKVIHDFKRRRGRKRSWKAGLGVELVRDVEALQAQRVMTTKEAIQALRKNKTKGWHDFTEQNLTTRHREARTAERKRRIMAQQLMVSPPSPMMGGIFGLSPPKPTKLDDGAK